MNPPKHTDFITLHLPYVREEVETSFTMEEIAEFKNFEEFFDQVDTMNAYEETWNKWKRKGIQAVYSIVFKELKQKLNPS